MSTGSGIDRPLVFGIETSCDDTACAIVDGAGRVRDKDQGLPIDTTGTLTGTEDIDGIYDGAAALAGALGRSRQVRACLVTQLFRYAYARAESDDDACTVALLNEAFTASGGDVRKLLVSLTRTPAFTSGPAGGAP